VPILSVHEGRKISGEWCRTSWVFGHWRNVDKRLGSFSSFTIIRPTISAINCYHLRWTRTLIIVPRTIYPGFRFMHCLFHFPSLLIGTPVRVLVTFKRSVISQWTKILFVPIVKRMHGCLLSVVVAYCNRFQHRIVRHVTRFSGRHVFEASMTFKGRKSHWLLTLSLLRQTHPPYWHRWYNQKFPQNYFST